MHEDGMLTQATALEFRIPMRPPTFPRPWLLLAIAPAFIFSACGEMRWQKSGGDDAALAQDLAACNKEARDRYGGPTALLPPVGLDPRFGPTGASQADVVMRESQVAGACMRAKGYALVPK
jgi:hypothetical protein